MFVVTRSKTKKLPSIISEMSWSGKDVRQHDDQVNGDDRLCFMDTMLTLVGNRLDERLFGIRGLGSVCNHMMRLLITLSAIAYLTIVVESVEEDGGFTALTVMETINMVTGVAVMLLMTRRRRRMRKWLTRLQNCELLGDLRGYSLLNQNHLLLSVNVLFVCFKLVIQLILCLDAEYEGWELVLMLSLHLFLSLNQFDVTYPIVYRICVKMMTEQRVHHLKQVTHKLNETGVLDVLRVMQERDQLHSLKQEFEAIFNPIPFILFSMLFVTIPGEVAGHGVFNDPWSDRATTILTISFIVHHAILMLMVWTVVQAASDCQDESSDALALLIRSLDRSSITVTGRRVSVDALRRQLLWEQELALTGYKLFDVHRSVLLPFISSIISFSVLLVQLTSSS